MENDDITRYLASLEREDCYRVDATLKESPHELTQRVFFVGANSAEQGPYVRKFIHLESGMGNAYERIFDAQKGGKRFKHVPAVHECYRRDDFLVVVMEFVDGETLQDAVYRRNPSEQLAAEVFPLLCDAATELHESFDPPLIHRDLKPSNVMLTSEGAVIIDFGIARDFKLDAESDTTKFGTRAFAPPEQFGFGQTTVRSDVYALGMLLYYCLTEKIPTMQARDAGFREPNVPACLLPVLARATALDPSERYGSASELKGAFVEALAQSGSGRQAKGRRRAPIAIACIAVLLAAIVCGFFAINLPQQPNGQEETTASNQNATRSSHQSSADETTQTSTGEVKEATVLEGLQSSAPPRDGFDPATCIATTIAGVTFQIPDYFAARVSQGDGDVTYYYAESGSSLSMIMTAENRIPVSSDAGDSDDSVETAKDEYLAGVLESNDKLFAQTVSSTDCMLAGHPARIVTLRGSAEGLPMTTKAVYFINTSAEKGTYIIGSIIFGQTDNAQFDYSTDFAKVIASAVSAS